jgi:hypothetical protein
MLTFKDETAYLVRPLATFENVYPSLQTDSEESEGSQELTSSIRRHSNQRPCAAAIFKIVILQTEKGVRSGSMKECHDSTISPEIDIKYSK